MATHQRSLLNRLSLGMLGRSDPPRQQLRRFEAARIDRLNGGWFSTSESINQELRGDLDLLRHRGRNLINNNDYARKFKGMAENNIIGPGGIRYQARVSDGPGRPDRAANAAIEAARNEWQRVCDVSGRLHFRDFCAQLVGGLPSDGEFLVRLVSGTPAGNRFNFALQAIDVDRIDTTYSGKHGTNTVIMGVEVNDFLRPVAMHIFSAHPSDGIRTSRIRERVPMSELIHCFRSDRPGQTRGIPWMAPGMMTLHHLGGFMTSAVLAAEHGANHFGFFTTPDGGPPVGGENEQGETITTSQPGVYDTLPTGVTFQAHESKYPDQAFGPFVKTALQRVATGWRVAYVSLANDLEGVSYSSIRSGVLEERDRWMDDQEWFIEAFLRRVDDAWLEASLTGNAITMPNGSALPMAKRQKFAAREYQPRRWEWVDPKGDIEAKVLMVKAGLMAPQDLAAAMGYDFDDTLTAIKAAQDLAAQLGVSLPAYDAMPGAAPPLPAQAA
jgi:lambda family phage portal protein